MIKAVIFDCFGVLTSEGWQEFKHTHFTDKETLDEANRLNYLADQGKMNHEQLLPMVAELAGISTEQARAEIDDYQPNKRLIDYIKKSLKKKYKIGMLSNVSDDWLQNIFKPEQIEIFDGFALSYKMGFAKPDKRAYEYIADKLGVKMSECVFLDDSEYFSDEATKYGMKGIHFKNFEQAKINLEEVLEMTDSNK